jgi:hypothetical protein
MIPWLWTTAPDDDNTSTDGGPHRLDDRVMIGYHGAATTIDIFDGPLCPHCSASVTSSAVT